MSERERVGAALHGLLRGPRWSRDRLRRYQGERLRALVRHAVRRVPFYRDLYGREGVNPDRIRDAEDIVRLPVTSRRDLQAFGEDNLRAQGLAPRSLSRHCTSGSTGEPLRVWRTRSEELLLAAFRLRALRQFGVRPGERLASVQFLPEGARPVRRPGPFVRRVWPHFEIHCQLEIEAILAVLREVRPAVLAGLPPVLDRICEALGPDGDPRLRPRLVISGAEVLTPAVRERLEGRFAAPVFDRYGAVECRLIAASCPRFPSRYHVCGDAVLVEVLKDGRPAQPGEEGEVLVTALHSYAMPFIRYRVGDLVRLEAASCPCGSPYAALAAVRGRLLDRLIRADGSEVHIPVVIHAVPEAAPWIRRFRVVQREAGRVVIEVMSGDDPGPERRAATERRLEERIDGMRVSIEMRPDLRPDETGTFRLFRSEIADGTGPSS